VGKVFKITDRSSDDIERSGHAPYSALAFA
jgi:hypothetical protein